MPAKYQDERVPSSNYAVIRWFGFDQFVPERAVTSYWITSKLLLTIRFILAFYSAIVFWTYLGLVAVYAPRFDKFFSMFTTFTFIGLHAYLVVSICFDFTYRTIVQSVLILLLDFLCSPISIPPLKEYRVFTKSTCRLKLSLSLPLCYSCDIQVSKPTETVSG